ncbi:hypothetical protein BDN72DRAFT_865749 [Pluteus cervinus]|uniref:Uncharacterized protein n=1 Tax=Pluteus cervinus TaxID=181527 RepID=A0ACD2ZYZ0_9AGAR|nr:hypothetical protein BDN72DRAFT_865749 [Pluteus cervinus]
MVVRNTKRANGTRSTKKKTAAPRQRRARDVRGGEGRRRPTAEGQWAQKAAARVLVTRGEVRRREGTGSVHGGGHDDDDEEWRVGGREEWGFDTMRKPDPSSQEREPEIAESLDPEPDIPHPKREGRDSRGTGPVCPLLVRTEGPSHVHAGPSLGPMVAQPLWETEITDAGSYHIWKFLGIVSDKSRKNREKY